MSGFRTLIVSALVGIFGVLNGLDWTSTLGSTKAGWIVTGIGAVMAILRVFTTTPVGVTKP